MVRKRVHLLLFSLLLFGILWWWQSGLLSDFSVEQRWTLGLLAFAIYLWTVAPLPIGASSILLLACILAFQLVQNPDEAFVGFSSTALYFILILSLVSQALVRAGVDQVFVRIILRLSKGGAKSILLGMPLLIMVMPIFLPSAVARFKIMLPLIERMNTHYGFGAYSFFRKYSMYVIGMMNQKSTMVVFTGGGFTILAAQLLQDFAHVNLSWLDWFLRIAPPLWLSMILISVIVWFYFKKTTSDEVILGHAREIESEEVLPEKFWVTMVPFVVMILCWMVVSQDFVPLILPPMLLVAYYAWPKIGWITNGLIRTYDWENFLLLGASFSLGIIIEANGTAQVLAEQLLQLLPVGAGDLTKIVFIGIFVFVLRFMFVVPSTAMIVIFPIVISYAEILGLSVTALALLVVMIIGGVMILPIHSPTTYYAYETGVFTKKEQYTIGVITSVVIVSVAVLWAYFIW
ncbi:SLC13 family permease [Jeotgalibacillus marinus]|uniref:SLC13 family permease n=1 Tax=Jeotgalibacillus marinus TaxID=86667 RepID=A0ABV3Q4F0_9BACL